MKNYHYINYKYKKKEYKLYLLLSKIGISFYYTFKNDHLIPHINGKEKSRRGWKLNLIEEIYLKLNMIMKLLIYMIYLLNINQKEDFIQRILFQVNIIE